MQANYKILLVGSGLMTPPLVDYLTKFKDTRITVASNLIEDAQRVAKRAPDMMEAVYLDVFDVSANFAKDNHKHRLQLSKPW